MIKLLSLIDVQGSNLIEEEYYNWYNLISLENPVPDEYSYPLWLAKNKLLIEAGIDYPLGRYAYSIRISPFLDVAPEAGTIDFLIDIIVIEEEIEEEEMNLGVIELSDEDLKDAESDFDLLQLSINRYINLPLNEIKRVRLDKKFTDFEFEKKPDWAILVNNGEETFIKLGPVE